MGIEALASIAKVSSVVPRAGGLTASFGAPIGRIGAGIEGGFKVGRIANPFKEVNRPILSPKVETIKPLSHFSVMRVYEPMVVIPPVRKAIGEFRPIMAPITESKNVSRLVSPTLKPEVQIQQVVEERKIVKNEAKEDKSQAKKSEKITVLKVQFVEAVHISEKRKLEIKTAVKQASEEAQKTGIKITGRLVVRFLSFSFWKHKSPIVREGKDGSIDPTVYELQKDKFQYQTELEAESSLLQAVGKHIPVTQGQAGRLATIGEVREVREGKEKEVMHSQTPAEMVIKRIISKNVEVAGEKTEEVVETSLENFPVLTAA